MLPFKRLRIGHGFTQISTDFGKLFTAEFAERWENFIIEGCRLLNWAGIKTGGTNVMSLSVALFLPQIDNGFAQRFAGRWYRNSKFPQAGQSLVSFRGNQKSNFFTTTCNNYFLAPLHPVQEDAQITSNFFYADFEHINLVFWAIMSNVYHMEKAAIVRVTKPLTEEPNATIMKTNGEIE